MDRDDRYAGFGAGFGAGRRTGSAAQTGNWGGYGGGAMRRLSQPPLHPDELAVSRSSAVGCRSRQNDQGIWRADRTSGRQDDWGLSQGELWGVSPSRGPLERMMFFHAPCK